MIEYEAKTAALIAIMVWLGLLFYTVTAGHRYWLLVYWFLVGVVPLFVHYWRKEK
jgi:4-hydroxybenzoate polyprenyltransferase